MMGKNKWNFSKYRLDISNQVLEILTGLPFSRRAMRVPNKGFPEMHAKQDEILELHSP